MQWDQQIFVAELNIEHFRVKLSGPLDDAQRRTVTTLLAEEEAKLVRLKGAAAERDLSSLIDLLAMRASALFDGDLVERHGEAFGGFANLIEHLPFGMGLVDGAGEMVLSNPEMQQFVPNRIPSRDAERMQRFQSVDGPLNPFLWPGARALRGDPVNPGIAFIFTSQAGDQTQVRVAAVPVRDGARIAGALAAVYDPATLGHDASRRRLALLVAEEQGLQRPGSAASQTP